MVWGSCESCLSVVCMLMVELTNALGIDVSDRKGLEACEWVMRGEEKAVYFTSWFAAVATVSPS